MLSANIAYTNSLSNRTVQSSQKVADEIIRLEGVINRAISVGSYGTGYNALLVGNPAVEVSNTDGLTDLQQEFLDVLIDSGYTVTREESNGWWYLSWAQLGPESSVTIYTMRTTVTPGPVSSQTVEFIQDWFRDHNPSATAKVTFFNPTNTGGDIPEADFGATDSEFYEYVIVATQQNALDYSSDLRTDLNATDLGYTTQNMKIWRV